MKTSEFIKKVEDMGYRAEITGNTMFIKGKYGVFLGFSYFQFENHFQIDTADLKLAKLCIEYAETPLADREEEKKYTVVLPDPRNDSTHRYMLVKRYDGIRIGWCHVSHLQGLTESEIKRNHEYLWQFAKEVKE